MVFHAGAPGEMGENAHTTASALRPGHDSEGQRPTRTTSGDLSWPQRAVIAVSTEKRHKVEFGDKPYGVRFLASISRIAACFAIERIEVLPPNLAIAPSIAAGC